MLRTVLCELRSERKWVWAWNVRVRVRVEGEASWHRQLYGAVCSHAGYKVAFATINSCLVVPQVRRRVYIVVSRPGFSDAVVSLWQDPLTLVSDTGHSEGPGRPGRPSFPLPVFTKSR